MNGPKNSVLVNCSNLHTGGGVAVATSFIDCLSRMDHEGLCISLLLSTSVERNLRALGTNLGAFAQCQTQDFHGLAAMWQRLERYFKGQDLVFTVFGPAYFVRRRTRHLFGFAQPNILYADNPVAARQGLLARWRTRAKFALQAWFYSREDAFVVELEHVRSGLLKNRLFQDKPVHIVYNSVHSVFDEPQSWAPLELPHYPGRLRLGVISRNYPHKNLAILVEVKRHLQQAHGRATDIYVTFPPDEWAACNDEFRENVINAGVLSLSQCPSFYTQLDGVVFPSLLECFSAAPIETMKVGRPLFASDLSFIRDVCGDHCEYFDPLNAADIAHSIDAFFSLPAERQQQRCEAARAHVGKFPGPDERAAGYLKVIRQTLA